MLINPKEIPQVNNDIMNILHEDEIEIINKFHDAVIAKDIDKIDEVFPLVLYDVEDHFSTEEAMMKERRYNLYQMHKNDHDSIREKLKKAHKDWQENKDPSAIKEFLENEFLYWIKLHISKWDSEAAPHLDSLQ